MAETGQILDALSAQLQRVAALAHAAEALRDRLDELRGDGRSEDRDVTASVDHRGMVLDLSFSDSALDAGPDHLAVAVTQAVEDAIRDVRRQAEPLRREILPKDASTGYDTSLGEQLDALYERVERQTREGNF